MQSYGISNVFFHRNTPNCCQDTWLWITTIMVALKETSGNLHSHLTQSMGTRNVCSIIVVHIYSSEPKPHPKAIVWPEDEKRFLLWIRFHGLVHGQWETEDIIRQQTATPPVPPCAVYWEKKLHFSHQGAWVSRQTNLLQRENIVEVVTECSVPFSPWLVPMSSCMLPLFNMFPSCLCRSLSVCTGITGCSRKCVL